MQHSDKTVTEDRINVSLKKIDLIFVYGAQSRLKRKGNENNII